VIDPHGATGVLSTEAGPLEMQGGVAWTWNKDQAQEASARLFDGIHVEREEPYPSEYGKMILTMRGCRACREHVCQITGHKDT
jgi:hypothetical protein